MNPPARSRRNLPVGQAVNGPSESAKLTRTWEAVDELATEDQAIWSHWAPHSGACLGDVPDLTHVICHHRRVARRPLRYRSRVGYSGLGDPDPAEPYSPDRGHRDSLSRTTDITPDGRMATAISVGV